MNILRGAVISMLLTSTFFGQLFGQINDCEIAGVICNDGLITFSSDGPGKNDFANANNNPGCLNEGEHQSAWYYFEFMPNMAPNSIIEFSISPKGSLMEDYDFAIYGPNVTCDALGTPVRCSFASGDCEFCPITGLSGSADDTTEGANGDGFLKAMIVQPGQGYYLFVDNWLGSESGFDLDWGGSAADFLNCNADPNCPLVVNPGADIITCVNPGPIQINATVENNNGTVRYQWEADGDIINYLSDPNIPDPILTIPAGLLDTFTLTLNVADNVCSKSNILTIAISDQFNTEIKGPDVFCQGNPATLSLPEGYESYQWSTGETSSSIKVTEEGTYKVTITSIGGCIGTDEIVMETPFPSPGRPEIRGDTILCQDASVALRVVTGYASYAWSHGTRNPGTLIREPGFYGVTITNEYGCPASDTVEVIKVNAQAEEVEIGSTIDICFNEVLTLDAGDKFAEFEWSNKSENQAIKVDTAGLYCVTVKDRNGCKSKDCVIINEYEFPNLYLTGLPSFCKSGTTIGVNDEFESYAWSTGENTPEIYADEAQPYSVTVTDNEGCKDTLIVNVRNNQADPPVIDGALALCDGASTNLIVENDYATYNWSTGERDKDVFVNQPGSYGLTVTDNEGCTTSRQYNIQQNSSPSPTLKSFPSICPGDTIMLETVTNYATYAWSDGTTEPFLEVHQPGDYSLTVTNEQGCEGAISFTVLGISNPEPNILGNLYFCEGDFTELAIQQDFVAYEWSTGLKTAKIKIETPGQYSLTVTDENGCNGIEAFEIQEVPTPTIDISGQNYLCEGENIRLDVGAGFERYTWSTGQTSSSITVNQPGTFVVEVNSFEGCSDKASITVSEAPKPIPIIEGPTFICNGEMTMLSTEDDYMQYIWSNGDTSASTTINHPGTYSLSVTDEKGCTGNSSIDIQANNNDPIKIIGDTLLCAEGNGTLGVEGTFDQYLWSTGATTPTISVSITGTYRVTVTQSGGCTKEGRIEVGRKTIKGFDILGNQYLCFGGAIELKVGRDFSSYLWSTGDTTQAILANQVGIYSVTVVDETGCSATEALEVFGDASPNYNDMEEILICPNSSTTLQVSQIGIAYDWSNGEKGRQIEVDNPGLYEVTITDENGCNSVTQVNLIEPDFPSIQLPSSEPISCKQPSIFLALPDTINLPEALYEYRWKSADGQQIGDIGQYKVMVDQPGLYYLELTQLVNGCSKPYYVEVGEDQTGPVVNMESAMTLNCYYSEITLGPVNQIDESLEYEWTILERPNLGPFKNPLLQTDQSGRYLLKSTNPANGCSAFDTVTVTADYASPMLTLENEQHIDCNDQSITLHPTIEGTSGLYNFTWIDALSGDTLANTPSLQVKAQGEYILYLQNRANGCFTSDIATVSKTEGPTEVMVEIQHPSCHERPDGKLTVLNVMGGIQPYRYQLFKENEVMSNSMENLTAGQYQLTVQDANDCQLEKALTLVNQLAPTVDLGPDQSIKFGETVDLVPQTNLTTEQIDHWQWDSESSIECEACWTLKEEPLENSFYALTIFTPSGCAASDTVMIKVEQPRQFYTPNAFTPNGDGDNDYFSIIAGQDVALIKSIAIYNRWGQQVFHRINVPPNDPAFAWNGKSDGQQCPSEVYLYMAEIEFVDGFSQKINGDVTLIR